LTPAFAGPGVSTRGVLWAVARVLAWLTVVGFTAATWGLFTRHGWWEPVALGSAAVGLVSLVPFWIAAHRAGEVTPWWNVLVHLIGIVGVSVLLLVPYLERWVDHHVMGS